MINLIKIITVISKVVVVELNNSSTLSSLIFACVALDFKLTYFPYARKVVVMLCENDEKNSE